MTFTVKGVTARKRHRCNLCNRVAILPGHRYLRRVQFPDSMVSFSVTRMCLACCLDRAEDPGTEVDDPLMLASACGTSCHGVTPCVLHGDHTGEHACRECGPR